jgi:hypothetical protein
MGDINEPHHKTIKFYHECNNSQFTNKSLQDRQDLMVLLLPLQIVNNQPPYQLCSNY